MAVKELEKETQDQKNKVREAHSYEKKVAVPLADVYSDDKGIYIESEMTGVNKDSLKIDFEQNLLTIEGKQSLKEAEGYELRYAEFGRVTFKRQFRIEGVFDTEKIKAQIKNGVLKVSLPFTEKKIKKIPISSD